MPCFFTAIFTQEYFIVWLFMAKNATTSSLFKLMNLGLLISLTPAYMTDWLLWEKNKRQHCVYHLELYERQDQSVNGIYKSFSVFFIILLFSVKEDLFYFHIRFLNVQICIIISVNASHIWLQNFAWWCQPH